jgi:hypothetical protein
MDAVELTYVRMEPHDRKGKKTKLWEVMTKDDVKDPGGGHFLGEVKWFGRWRGYAFFPMPDTIYEHKCLREIADFVQDQTRKHMAGKRAKKK